MMYLKCIFVPSLNCLVFEAQQRYIFLRKTASRFSEWQAKLYLYMVITIKLIGKFQFLEGFNRSPESALSPSKYSRHIYRILYRPGTFQSFNVPANHIQQ